MEKHVRTQIVISGIGGQGVLFITRLLAEAAIGQGLPVFTSETHGMAQRGGTVISHLKVGVFSSPLIVPGNADGMIALKAECLAQHGDFLKPGGWTAVNRPPSPVLPGAPPPFCLDAEGLAMGLGSPKTVHLIMLGFALAAVKAHASDHGGFFCQVADIAVLLEHRLGKQADQLQTSLAALRAGAQQAGEG